MGSDRGVRPARPPLRRRGPARLTVGQTGSCATTPFEDTLGVQTLPSHQRYWCRPVGSAAHIAAGRAAAGAAAGAAPGAGVPAYAAVVAGSLMPKRLGVAAAATAGWP